MLRYVVFYTPGSKWIPGKSVYEQPLKYHVNHVGKLMTEKRLIACGPFTDSWGGMTIFEADNLEEAQDFVKNDPAIINQILIGHLHPWHILKGDIQRIASLLSL
jgi:uncharacterized protein YciI